MCSMTVWCSTFLEYLLLFDWFMGSFPGRPESLCWQLGLSPWFLRWQLKTQISRRLGLGQQEKNTWCVANLVPNQITTKKNDTCHITLSSRKKQPNAIFMGFRGQGRRKTTTPAGLRRTWSAPGRTRERWPAGCEDCASATFKHGKTQHHHFSTNTWRWKIEPQAKKCLLHQLRGGSAGVGSADHSGTAYSKSHTSWEVKKVELIGRWSWPLLALKPLAS